MFQLQHALVFCICLTGILASHDHNPVTINNPWWGRDPCRRANCPFGTECRLQSITCIRPPCFPTVTCQPVRPSTVSCQIGKPVIDGMGRELRCDGIRVCPDGTTCVPGFFRRSGCCFTGFQGPLRPIINQGRNPCRFANCPLGTECRLQRTICIREPCFPTSTCQPVRPSTVMCQVGKPVIGISGRDIRCGRRRGRGRGRRCPTGTTCVRDGFRRSGCCYTEFQGMLGEKPGFCRNTPLGNVGNCIQECFGDQACPGAQKCCSNGCGRTCQIVGIQFIQKPGMCPNQSFRTGRRNLRCRRQCFTDQDCSGMLKCCSSRRCGQVCMLPIECPFWNPNCQI